MRRSLCSCTFHPDRCARWSHRRAVGTVGHDNARIAAAHVARDSLTALHALTLPGMAHADAQVAARCIDFGQQALYLYKRPR